MERAIREYAIAPVALYVLSGVKPVADAVESACIPAQKKLNSLQRRRDFLKAGPTELTLGRNYPSLRQYYLDEGGTGKELSTMIPSFEKAIEAFCGMMSEYIAKGGKPWVMTTELVGGVEKPVYAKDADGKESPTIDGYAGLQTPQDT